MTTELQALIRQFRLHPVAVYYAKQALTGFDDKRGAAMDRSLKSSLERTVQLDAVKSVHGGSDTVEDRLQGAFQLFPTFIFRLCADLTQDPACRERAQHLLFAGIQLGLVLERPKGRHLELFLDQCDAGQELSILNHEVFENGELNPRRLTFQDLMLMAKYLLRRKPSNELRRQIEALFHFQGLSQIFLRYHFELVQRAADDTIARHVDAVFSRFFMILRLEEIRYFKAIGNIEVVRNRLLTVIQQNLKHKRHPVLKKEVFDVLKHHHPIIHDGRARGLTKTANELLQEQLGVFAGLSLVKLALFLNIVYKTRGNEYAVYLLTQLLKSQKDKLFELVEFLRTTEDKSFEALARLVTSFTARFRKPESPPADSNHYRQPGPQVLLGSQTARLAAAKKNIERNRQRKDMMTPDKVSAYLDEWLKKLYKRVKKSGALTADQVPAYLARFAEVTEPIMAEVSPTRQKELVEAFEESTDEILAIISEHDQLSQEEMSALKDQIQEKIQELDSADVEKRAEAVEAIGMTLTDASEKAERRQKEINVDAFLKQNSVDIGFDAMAQSMSLAEFFTLPLGERQGPDESDWFAQHRQYLELAVEKKRFPAEQLDTVKEILPSIPRIQYRKYFNVFPGGEYEDTVISAVYDIWKSRAIDNIKVG